MSWQDHFLPLANCEGVRRNAAEPGAARPSDACHVSRRTEGRSQTGCRWLGAASQVHPRLSIPLMSSNREETLLFSLPASLTSLPR